VTTTGSLDVTLVTVAPVGVEVKDNLAQWWIVKPGTRSGERRETPGGRARLLTRSRRRSPTDRMEEPLARVLEAELARIESATAAGSPGSGS
jgi:hypothetical protein